jgi:sterol desaturase/sphingolipid hydroxylase (fatty acid hydroxylase superfamily)
MYFYVYFIPITALTCIVFFSLLDVFFGKRMHAFLFQTPVKVPTQATEIRNTIISFLIFAGSGLLLDYLNAAHVSAFYQEVKPVWYAYAYLLASLFIALFIHDFFFYMSHRLLHIPFFFKTIHQTHHRTKIVQPWASFSFHPFEGIVQISIVVWLPLVLPMHPIVHAIFTFFLLFMSVYGHSGYELRALKAAVFTPFNTSIHHAQHHQFVSYNFGIYLNLWDRLFQTNHPSYPQEVERVKQQIIDSKVGK